MVRDKQCQSAFFVSKETKVKRKFTCDLTNEYNLNTNENFEFPKSATFAYDVITLS